MSMHRMWGVATGVMVGALAIGVGGASAASWRASIDTPFPAFASNTSGSDSPHTVVADGHVWWLSYGGRYRSPTYPVMLRSRSLGSGTTRKLRLDTVALTHPAPAVDAVGRTTEFPQPSVQQFKVRDGRVYVIGGWGPGPGTDGPGADQTFYAAFSTETGKPVLDQPIRVSEGGGFGRRFIDGDPAVLALETSSAVASGPSLDPAMFAALPVDAADVREVAGRFALSLAPTDRHDDTQIRGTGTATVRDLRTGKTRYRVTARTIADAAGGELKRQSRLEPRRLPEHHGQRTRRSAVAGRGRRLVWAGPAGRPAASSRGLDRGGPQRASVASEAPVTLPAPTTPSACRRGPEHLAMWRLSTWAR
ncbi:hypothetical protein AB0L40_06080 [Patulibacter sp. NPDC049589]|uniref:hypothetical protein n=1 Tax=Patulibacter sp. NPDC049589 TaxID=3154731 RepID=UPI003416B0E6